MHYAINKLKSQIEKQKTTLLDDEGSLSIESLLSSDKFQSIINNCRSFRSCFYTPFVTLILFIRQVLSPDKSCKNTVANFLASVSTEDNNNIPSSIYFSRMVSPHDIWLAALLHTCPMLPYPEGIFLTRIRSTAD